MRANGIDPDSIDDDPDSDFRFRDTYEARGRKRQGTREWTQADDQGFARTPPRTTREESITPPRKRRRRSSSLEYEKDRLETSHGLPADHFDPNAPPLDEDYDESSLPPSILQFLSRRQQQKEALEEAAFRQKLFDLMEDEEGPHPITSGRYPSPPPPPAMRIPERWKGPVEIPGMEMMDDEEYTESIRFGIWKMKNKDEWERRERLAKLKTEEEARKGKEKSEREREEKKRIEILQRERGKVEEKRAKRDRDDYVDGWLEIKERLGEKDGKRYKFREIPWPVYKDAGGMALGLETFTMERIQAFLETLTSHSSINNKTDTTETKEDDKANYRRIIRDAVLRYHPDRFERVLGVVVEKERELVREGAGAVSRVLNDLNSAL